MTKKASDTPKLTAVILVTHADYGERLLHAAMLILGPQSGCASISVDVGSDVATTLGAIRQAIMDADTGNGALLVTDMFGGTPTNLSLSLLGTGDVAGGQLEVITGVNLPMLLKILTTRQLLPAELAKEARKAGLQGIVVAGDLLRQKVAGE